MGRYIIIAGAFLFLQLHTAAQALDDKTTADLLTNLQKSKPDSNRLSLLYQLGSFYLVHYDNKENYFDSAVYFFRQELELGKKLNFNGQYGIDESLLMIGASNMYTNRPDEARKYFMPLINAYHLSGEKSKEANVWVKWAYYIPFRVLLTDKLYNLKQAATLYHENGDKQMEIHTAIDIADVYLQNDKSVIAENLLLNILDSNTLIKPDNLFNIYYLLSVINRYKGDFNKALSYSLKNLALRNEKKSVRQVSVIYGELGLIYQELGQHDKSIDYYIKTIEIKGNSTEFQIALYKTADFIVEQLIIQGKAKQAIHFIDSIAQKHPPLTAKEKASLAQTLGKCYDASGQYKVAEKYYVEMINYYEHSPSEKEYGILAQIVIGKFYLERRQYGKAEYYLNKALNASSSEIAISKVKDIHLMLYKVDSAQGNYLSAIDHLRKHQLLNDSIFNERKSKQIEELQIQYETQKKDQLIGLNEQNIQLLTKQGELQKGKLQQATTLKNITFAGIVLLIIIVLLLFNRYRVKQRTNNKLELQQKLINQKNSSLQNLVDEKEWLLKEIHHRVKNNLQMVISLLSSQSAYLENDAALNAINDSRHRVHAMSLIHQKLYNSENVSTINIPAYIGELVEYIRSCFSLGQRIHFVLDITPLDLDVSQAIPVGLILNEALTNSIKYAFPEGSNGIIKITLLHISGNLYELHIADDGIGMPGNFDEQQPGTLGMSLMKGLTEDLDGTFAIENNNGTVIKIVFVYDEVVNHSGALRSPEPGGDILE